MRKRLGARFWACCLFGAYCLTLTDCPCGGDQVGCENDEECARLGDRAPVCVDGQCRACREGDRSANRRCHEGVWEEATACSVGSCPAGEACLEGRCQPGCETDSDCDSGLCIASACDRSCDCRSNSECPGGLVCDQCVCSAASMCESRELQRIYFDFDEDSVRLDQEAALSENLECLQAYPDDHVTIEGHCDERGTVAYNLVLGEQRARNIKRYFEREGVLSRRLGTLSYGELRPLSPGHSESSWRQNRRAEFRWR